MKLDKTDFNRQRDIIELVDTRTITQIDSQEDFPAGDNMACNPKEGMGII